MQRHLVAMLTYLALVLPLFAAQTDYPPVVTQPRSGQVVQRDDIVIRGVLPEGTWDVEARFNSAGAYTTILTGESGPFEGTLADQTPGEGTLDVRLVGTTEVTSIPDVALGEVFVIAGQSNASGYVTNNQSYTGLLRGALFTNAYTWAALTDPTDDPAGQLDAATQDDQPAQGARGSVWPLLANLVEENLGVAVAIVPNAIGGSRITTWQRGIPDLHRGHRYGSTAYRTDLIGGARVILWWQGESDAQVGASRVSYNASLDAIADAWVGDTGIKLMACKLQNSGSIADALEAEINLAIGDAWADNPNVLQGPDLTDIASDDGVHVTTDGKAATVAQRWYDALVAAFGWS